MSITHSIFKWLYSYENGSFNITPNSEYEKPDLLYKIFSLNDYSIDSLEKSYVFATHPFLLNDLFDCNEELIDFDDIAVISSFFKDIISYAEIEDLAKKDLKNLKRITQLHFREKFYRKWGVYSMTSNPNNFLMWSYYCNHSGFCIEFDYTQFPFKYHGPFPINYQDELKPISVKECGIEIAAIAQANLKMDIWQHENEWRLMIEAAENQEMFSPKFRTLKEIGGHDRKFNYPINAINSISLGYRFFEPNEIEESKKGILDIELLPSDTNKKKLLVFLSRNEIITHICLKNGLNGICFSQPSIVKQINENVYRIKII